MAAACSASSRQDVLARASGGTTCLALLVSHRFSSEVVNNVATSISRIRQVMP